MAMKFGIDKCAVLELERGRLVRSEGIELPDGERKTLEMSTFQIDLQIKSKYWEFHLLLECLVYGCDEVQRRNYRLDKRGTSVHGPEN